MDTSFKDMVNKKRHKVEPTTPDVSAVKGGRVSKPDDVGTIGGLIQELSETTPDFNIQLLGALDTLAKFNPSLSQAVDNVRQLGNTEYNIYFDDSVSEEMSKEMMLRIRHSAKNWYAYSGGVNSLINDLLAQLAITGALSAESVILPNLAGVKKAVIVNPKNIRFVYDKDKDEYQPYQQLQHQIDYSGGLMNRIKLNTTTYKYIALGRTEEKPYGIPPFLSALESIAIGRDIQDNLRYVVKKLGLLGFLEVLITGPKPQPNEKAEDYFKRTQAYLNQVVPEIEKGMSKGFVAGFDGVHKFNMQNTTSNTAGTKDLVEMNDIQTMSGLKQDPLMFGRNFSTTETLGRVILAKMTTQVGNYQKIVASFLESMFLIDLQLAGYDIHTLDVIFDPPMIGDKVRDEQARGANLTNLDKLLDKGIIDIYQYAQEAGYEKPADPEKHKINPLLDSINDPEEEDDAVGDEDVTDPKTTATNNKILSVLGASRPMYRYGHDENCSCEQHRAANMNYSSEVDSDLAYFINLYKDATTQTYNKALNKTIRLVANKLLELGNGATEQDVMDSVMYHFFGSWQTNFTKPQAKIVSKFVTASYEFFRKDDSIFGGKEKEGGIPKSVFDQVDNRVIDYYKRSDDFYLGKFVTDEDTRKKMYKFIHDKYLNRELPIGNNQKAMDAFRSEFGELMGLEDWKIQRIINTTVNNLRSTAAIKYMEQASVASFEVRGITDRLQCGYCANMQGKTFSIKTAVRQIEQYSLSDPAFVPIDKPFINSVYKNPDDIVNLTGAELQAKGISSPPFHSNCRDTIVAVL